jgi:peptidoglycan-associated lipoprotein
MFRLVMLALCTVLAAGCARDVVSTTNPLGLQAETAGSVAPGESAVVGADTLVPGSLRDFTDNIGDRIFFAYDRYDLDATAIATLLRQAAWLTQYPAAAILIEGHADERGTREYNLALAARRATVVRDYLTGFGIAPSRLETISYGKERPECFETAEFCWSRNRRSVSALRHAANF